MHSHTHSPPPALSRHQRRRQQSLLAMLCGGLATLGLLVVFALHSGTSASMGGSRPRSQTVASTAELTTLDTGVEVLIRTPLLRTPLRYMSRYSGLVLVFHGCSHGAYDWASPAECRRCIGLPEERLMADSLVAAGMVVVAPSSADRDSKCWHVQ